MKMQIESPRSSAIVAVIVLATMLGVHCRVDGAPLALKARSDSGSAQLELDFAGAMTCESSTPAPRELLLRCDHGLDMPSVDGVLAQSQPWIAWISNGYDTLLIHAARDVEFTVSNPSSGRIVLELRAAGTEAPMDESSRVTSLLLRSHLLAATGRSNAAADLLREVLQISPANGQALTGLAELELRTHRWRRALALYSRAIAAEPRNEDWKLLRSRLFSEHESAVSSETNSKNVSGQWSELVASVAGTWQWSEATKAIVRIDDNRFSLFGSDQAYRQSRLEASIQHDFMNGADIAGAILDGGHGIGSRMVYNRPDASGKTHLETEYGAPFWDVLQSLEGDGLRDRVTAGREQFLNRKTALQWNFSLNRYRMGDAVVRRTYGFTSGVNYTLQTQSPTLELNYQIDLERLTDSLPAASFPLANRNVHSLGSSINVPLGLKAELLAASGLSYDLDGGHGPFFAARYKRRLAARLFLEAWIERRQNSILTGSVVRNVGASLRIALPSRGPQ